MRFPYPNSLHDSLMIVLLNGGLLLFADFPWFKEVPIGSILQVEQPTPGHFYWPDLDVDLGVESIEHPERFPFKAKSSPKRG